MHFKSKTLSRELPKDKSSLGIALCLKRPASAISAAAFKSKSLRNSLIHRVCLQINKECHKLEKKSLLKKTGVRDLKHFQWNAVLKEWMKEAPTFYKVLKSIAMPPTLSRNQRKIVEAHNWVCWCSTAQGTQFKVICCATSCWPFTISWADTKKGESLFQITYTGSSRSGAKVAGPTL